MDGFGITGSCDPSRITADLFPGGGWRVFALSKKNLINSLLIQWWLLPQFFTISPTHISLNSTHFRIPLLYITYGRFSHDQISEKENTGDQQIKPSKSSQPTPTSIILPNQMATCTATAWTTSSSTLEITVISAEDLRQGRHHLGRGTFVTIRSGPSVVSTTASIEDSHNYPLWNERLHIREPSHGGWIQVDVSKRKHGDASNVVHVAGVKVPLSDFSYGPAGYKHFLSYRLRDQEGRGNGIVNLCVRRLGGNGEGQFNGGTHAMGYPVAPVGVSYNYGHSTYGKY